MSVFATRIGLVLLCHVMLCFDQPDSRAHSNWVTHGQDMDRDGGVGQQQLQKLLQIRGAQIKDG